MKGSLRTKDSAVDVRRLLRLSELPSKQQDTCFEVKVGRSEDVEVNDGESRCRNMSWVNNSTIQHFSQM
jgi:hypothetical protein